MTLKRIVAFAFIIALLSSFAVPAMAFNGTAGSEPVYVKYVDGTSEIVDVPFGMTSEQLVNKYEGQADVKYAEVDTIVEASATPNDPYYLAYQSAVFNAMKIPLSWDITYTVNSPVTIAVIDSGVDATHPDLQGRVLTNGYDFVNDDNDPNDETGHGTAVSGIISAITNNSKGMAGLTDCQILPIKALNAQGKGFASVLAESIVYAVDNGAKVINLSVGTTGTSQALADAVAYAKNHGVLMVGATGNTANAIDYPAAYSDVIAVGAVTSSKALATYSCFGSQIDITAVGSGVTGLGLNGKYITGDGTSFAAPFVSALSAIILEINPSLTPDQVESVIKTSAVDLGTTGWDQYYGAGCVDFSATLTAVTTGETTDPNTDKTAPVININGSTSITVNQNSPYTDAGATAMDDKDGDISAKIQVVNTVNTLVTGTYIVNYTVTDAAGNVAKAIRTVKVTAAVNTKPIITMHGGNVNIPTGTVYTDAGATVIDAEDGDITSNLIITGSVDTSKAGTYYIYYNATDSMGLKASVKYRLVTVLDAPNTKPVVTLTGDQTVTIVVGAVYTEQGATANDTEDGDLTAKIVKSGTVNTTRVGTYRITYLVKDSKGLTSAPVVRTVIVKANAKPVISIIGSMSTSLKYKEVYTELGATAKDTEDGDLTANIIITGSVDTSKAGTYYITYTVMDSMGATTTVKRTVKVGGDTKPVLTIKGSKTITLSINGKYIETGVVATDVEDGDLTSTVVTTGTVNTAKSGTYVITYSITDSCGNVTTATRNVVIKANAKPTLILRGSSSISLKVGSKYTEYGVMATDVEDGDITSKVIKSGTVNTAKAGTYKVVYSVTDSYGTMTTVTRTITVK